MKKTNRKIHTAIITSVALFSLFACNDNDKNKNRTVFENKTTTSVSQSVSTSAVTSQSDAKNTTENNTTLTSLSQTSVTTSPSETASSESKTTEVIGKSSDVSTAKTTSMITEISTEIITDTTNITTVTTPPVTTICDNALPEDRQYATVKNSSNDNTESSDTLNDDTAEVTQPAFADEDENYATEVTVTSDDKTVTSEQGSAQTEYVIIDDRNHVVTDTVEESVKLSAPIIPSLNVTEIKTKDSALWIGGIVTDESGKQSIKGFNDNGQFMEITFKVKENCQEGNYKVAFDLSTCSFSDNDLQNLLPVYHDGTITVGNAQAPQAQSSSSSTEVYLSNANAQPGETVTLYTSINNNTLGILGFVLSFSYNSDALELVSIQETGLIADFGDFETSL
ncbi:MAG: hypothetical protein E7510_04215 [Ruminococcus sp.]|nr:hypothetical protein [Ruminococcus sp.]